MSKPILTDFIKAINIDYNMIKKPAGNRRVFYSETDLA